MIKTYDFNAHSFELPIKRSKTVNCKVWEAKKQSPSVAVIEYDLGKNSNEQKIQELANHIVNIHNLSVVVIEYTETEIKYSPDLLNRLEAYLPGYLLKVSPYLSKRHQELILHGSYQEVINDLQYNAYTRIPVNQETIISLYGDKDSYTDFGIVASLDIIYCLKQLKTLYPKWQWNDCVGLGSGYGAYILQLAERFLPNTFSMIIAKNSITKPTAQDLFTNRTELENGKHKFIYRKGIGKFPLYLNEVQGWTTDASHPYFFEHRHFDIRNLENDLLLQKGNKKTPIIYIEEISEGIEKKINFVEKMIKNNYQVGLLVADQDEVDNKTIVRENGKITVKFKGIIDHYFSSDYKRNLNYIDSNSITILPVYNGVYVLNYIPAMPEFFFIPSNKSLTKENELDFLVEHFPNNINQFSDKVIIELLEYIKNPVLNQDNNYIHLIS
ncbi:hypothetical protein GCM10008967_06670 [Bacillus carboniphilus]|uniref:Uncharacterized protein n=1 Tax=Bacillus carboniphilus TaxID=86663 RepID=A0ABN0VWC6_9BACI